MSRKMLTESNLLIYRCKECKCYFSGSEWLEYKLLEAEVRSYPEMYKRYTK